jgi:hypothetical protein
MRVPAQSGAVQACARGARMPGVGPVPGPRLACHINESVIELPPVSRGARRAPGRSARLVARHSRGCPRAHGHGAPPVGARRGRVQCLRNQNRTQVRFRHRETRVFALCCPQGTRPARLAAHRARYPCRSGTAIMARAAVWVACAVLLAAAAGAARPGRGHRAGGEPKRAARARAQGGAARAAAPAPRPAPPDATSLATRQPLRSAARRARRRPLCHPQHGQARRP